MKRPLGLLSVLILLSLPSCKLFYPNMMFKMKDYQYFELAQKQIDQYIIQPGDVISVRIYARDGFKLIDVINAQAGMIMNVQINYLVDNEGFVRLPVINELFVKGYTEKELQRVLADKFAGLFVDPFVMVTVENRRAFVFKGSSASAISLNGAPTNIFEVIAKAGGLANNLKAYKIKLIRGDLKNPQVFLIDLSTLEGMRKADLIVQSNDIIYIEEKRGSIVSAVLGELSPYLSAITTVTTIILLARNFGR